MKEQQQDNDEKLENHDPEYENPGTRGDLNTESRIRSLRSVRLAPQQVRPVEYDEDEEDDEQEEEGSACSARDCVARCLCLWTGMRFARGREALEETRL
ncbi:unnamed protein product [Lampetra planeri]